MHSTVPRGGQIESTGEKRGGLELSGELSVRRRMFSKIKRNKRSRGRKRKMKRKRRRKIRTEGAQ